MSAATDRPDRKLTEKAIAAVALPLYRVRRRLATGLVVLVALWFAYGAIFGENGINVFAEKRSEDHAIEKRIGDLKQQNDQLQKNIQELKSDPDAIEHEARERLHYARPGEVIWTENGPAGSQNQQPAGSQPKNGQP